jgi:hypothetical protein
VGYGYYSTYCHPRYRELLEFFHILFTDQWTIEKSRKNGFNDFVEYIYSSRLKEMDHTAR